MAVLYVWDATNREWIPMGYGGVPSGGGGSVVDLRNEPFVTVSPSTHLTSERVLTAGPGISLGVTASAVVVSATGIGTLLDLPFLTLTPQVALANERYLDTDPGLDLTDGGPGNALTISPAWGLIPGTIEPDDIAGGGALDEFARIDHQHAIAAAAAGTIEPDDAAAEGVSTSFARADHQHAIVAANVVNIGVANAEGASTSFARADHVHAHPAALGTDLHHAEAHLVNSTGPHAEAGLTIGHMLRATGAAAFSFGAIQAGDIPHTLLDNSVHTDTVAAGVTRGSLIYGDATPEWNELVVGATSTHLESDGTDISWVSNLTMANDAWIGIGAGGGRVIFNDEATDYVTVDGGHFNVSEGYGFLVGYSALVTIGGLTPYLQMLGDGSFDTQFAVGQYRNHSSGPMLYFAKSRSGSIGSHTIVQDGDTIGEIRFYPSDGVDFATYSASISAIVDGTPGVNDLPAALLFKTAADGGTAVSECARFSQDGTLIMADGLAIEVDILNEATLAAGITADGVLLKDNAITCSGGATSGTITMTGSSIIRSLDTSYVIVSGGTATNVGGNIVYYGGTHATYPGAIAFRTDATQRMWITDAGVGVGAVSSPSAKLHVDQNLVAGAKPVLLLDQGDVDYVFIKFIGTASAAGSNRSLISASDFTTPGSIAGWVQIEVDDTGNRITDGDYWIPIYTDPSA